MYRIGVIEDDPIVRKLLEKVLASEGYESVMTTNVTDGFKVCAGEKPDLILLDVNLPDGNGIEACRRFKTDERLRHIPILLITGEASSVDNRIEGLEAGADDYVLKPFGTKEILSRIKGILRTAVRPTSR